MIIAISGKIGSGKDTIGNIIQYLTHKQDEYTLDSLITYESFIKKKYDEDAFNWKIKKFAYKLKQVCSLLTGIPVEDFEKQEVKDRLLGEEWTRTPSGLDYHNKYKSLGGYGILIGSESKDILDKEKQIREELNKWENEYKNPTVRWLLQTVGTEAMRDHIHTNVWINALFADYGISDLGKIKLRRKGMERSTEAALFEGAYDMNWVITDMRFPNELEAVKKRNGITIRIERRILTRPYEYDSSVVHPSETALDNSEFDYTIDNNGTIEELIEKVKDILIKEKII